MRARSSCLPRLRPARPAWPAQASHFRRGQETGLALAESSKIQVTDRDPHQTQHLDLMRRQQTANVPVATFVKLELEPTALFTLAKHSRASKWWAQN